MKNKTLMPVHLLPGLARHLGQVVNITASYLGIAVLVVLACLMLITYVPSISLTLRDLVY